MFVAACVAVIIEEPVPTIVTRPVIGLIVATDSSLLVYVKAPPLLVVGADSVNGASPKFLGGTIKLLIVCAIGLTKSESVVVADI